MELTASELDQIVAFADTQAYEWRGITFTPDSEPDKNADHGMNDEEEMV